MTLLTRVEAAVQMASQASDVAKQATVAEGIEAVAVQIREWRRRMTLAAERRAAIQLHAVGLTNWPDLAKVLASVAAFHAAFQAAPTGGKGELRKVEASLKKAVERAELSVSEAIDRCLSTLRAEARLLADDLGSVEGFVEDVAAVRRDTALLLEANWKRADGEPLAQLLLRRESILARLDSLVRADVPRDVRIFFHAARGGGAPLELLTEEVVAWLDQSGQRDRVRLVIR